MRKEKWKKEFAQLLSYFFVGGTAALVEWIMFFFFSTILQMHYQIATVAAFLVSTTTNWVLGRKFTFKSTSYSLKKQKEFGLVFGVSAVGLGLNIGLMHIWVSVWNMNTNWKKMIGKIAATGLIFFWNFFIRKYVIYPEKK